MEQAWRDDQLRRIGGGTSIFGRIPAEIGRVVYCDSTTGRAEGKAKLQTKEIVNIVCGACMLALAICLGAMGNMVLAVVLAVVGFFMLVIGFHKTNFMGKDFFIGEKGFATVSFERDRRSVTLEKVVLYDDISYLRTCETEVWVTGAKGRRHYEKTTCGFTFYSVDQNNSMATRLERYEGKFQDLRAHFRDNPRSADEEYQFMKMVEQIWTSRVLSMRGGDGVIYFPTIGEYGDICQCVDIYPWGLHAYGEDYREHNFKFDDITSAKIGKENKLTIKTEGGESATIDYSTVGNGKAMMELIYGRAKRVTPPPPIKQPRNPWAVTGLVLAILALIAALLMPQIGVMFCLAGVVCSLLGLRQAQLKSLAVLALILSVLSAAIGVYISTSGIHLLKI